MRPGKGEEDREEKKRAWRPGRRGEGAVFGRCLFCEWMDSSEEGRRKEKGGRERRKNSPGEGCKRKRHTPGGREVPAMLASRGADDKGGCLPERGLLETERVAIGGEPKHISVWGEGKKNDEG